MMTNDKTTYVVELEMGLEYPIFIKFETERDAKLYHGRIVSLMSSKDNHDRPLVETLPTTTSYRSARVDDFTVAIRFIKYAVLRQVPVEITHTFEDLGCR